MKIALVVMPWVQIDVCPLGVASLKAYLEAHGVEADCLYLNLRMAAQLKNRFATVGAMGFDHLERTWAELFFGYHLFGPGGTQELPASRFRYESLPLQHRISKPDAQRLMTREVPLFLKSCLEEVDWGRYDLIGFSSFFWSHTACLRLSRDIKRAFPDTPIVFGGANVQAEMGLATLKGCDWIDYVVDGEGEETLLALAKELQAGNPRPRLPGLSYRDGARIVPRDPQRMRLVDIDSLPMPDHGDFFEQMRRLGVDRWHEPLVTFESSRGCWWGEKQHCVFCGYNWNAMAYRRKAPETAVREILALQRKHGVSGLHAADNIIDMDYLRTLIPELKRIRQEGGYDWEILYEVKSNLNRSQLENLAGAGTVLHAGIESLSTPILRMMRKGVRGIQNIQTLKLSVESGVPLHWNFLYGFPHEDPGEYGRMMRTVLSITHLPPPRAVIPVNIDRFSPYHFDWKKLGIGRPRPAAIYEHVYPPERFSAEEMAYFFDFETPPPVPYRDALLEHAAFWTESAGRTFLAYRQGIDVISLYDHRALAPGGAPELSEHRLTGLEAFVFKLCETIQPAQQIFLKAAQSFEGVERRDVQSVLDRFLKERWFLQEDDLFLNLALPISKLTASQKSTFDKLQAIQRMFRRA